jgi:hypothetical protein
MRIHIAREVLYTYRDPRCIVLSPIRGSRIAVLYHSPGVHEAPGPGYSLMCELVSMSG